MSHGIEAKFELKCSIDVMRRALLKINKEWEKHLEVSSSGDLIWENKYTGEKPREGFHIRIKSRNNGGASDLYYADLALRKEPDNSWMILVDPSGANHIRNLKGYVEAQVIQMREIQKAIINGHSIVSSNFDEETGTTSVDIEIEDPNDFIEA